MFFSVAVSLYLNGAIWSYIRIMQRDLSMYLCTLHMLQQSVSTVSISLAQKMLDLHFRQKKNSSVIFGEFGFWWSLNNNLFLIFFKRKRCIEHFDSRFRTKSDTSRAICRFHFQEWRELMDRMRRSLIQQWAWVDCAICSRFSYGVGS